MENTSKTAPNDFFLWLGAIVALYFSIGSLITLLFEYINFAYPDQLAYYADPYSGAVRFSMAALMVLVPATLILFRLIRGIITREPGKAQIWVRRWGLMLTLFLATVTILIDLITIINTYLSGEIGVRFFLKAAIVLLIAVGVFLHFLADFKGYWITNVKKARLVGFTAAFLVAVSIISGFFIIGTPGDVRKIRFDEQKVNDLQNIQYQILNYYQQKGKLPVVLEDLTDPLAGYTVPTDAQTKEPYTYEVTGALSFKLCATFNAMTPDLAGRGGYPGGNVAYPTGGSIDSWQHDTGTSCFMRTIDPERYPVFKKSL